MTIEKVDQEVTSRPTIGPSGRSGINVVRQVGGLAVARWRSMRRKPMRRRLMRRTGNLNRVRNVLNMFIA